MKAYRISFRKDEAWHKMAFVFVTDYCNTYFYLHLLEIFLSVSGKKKKKDWLFFDYLTGSDFNSSECISEK